MDRLVRVVQREQRQPQGTQSFNSQPQAGWRREWKTAKGGSLLGPDLAWADDQSWLQGSKKCFDSSVTTSKAAGYAGVLVLGPSGLVFDFRPAECVMI